MRHRIKALNVSFETAQNLKHCFGQLSDAIARVQRQLTPRERLIMNLGLRASHAEEALMQADTSRAKSHFLAMVGLAERLGLLERKP